MFGAVAVLVVVDGVIVVVDGVIVVVDGVIVVVEENNRVVMSEADGELVDQGKVVPGTDGV